MAPPRKTQYTGEDLSRFVAEMSVEAPGEDGLTAEHDDEMEQEDAIVNEAAEIFRLDPRAAESTMDTWFGGENSRFEEGLAGVEDTQKGALAEGTHKSYSGQIKKFKEFVRTRVAPGQRDLTVVTEKTPSIVCLWIRASCEDMTSPSKVEDNSEIHEVMEIDPLAVPKAKKMNGWSSASTMRAAASYFFITEVKCEAAPFTRNHDGSWAGNPVTSTAVKLYMRGLKKQKVRAGEISESVRAISEAKLEKLYRHNSRFIRSRGIETRPTVGDGLAWAGWRQRLMMSLIYAIGFKCLLRLDEILNIQVRNIRCHDRARGEIEILLDWRKTHQTGGVRPFFHFFDRTRPWIDIPTLLFEWMEISGITEGYLFCPFWKSDQPKTVSDTTKKLSYTVFLDAFRRNLYDIGEDFELYGGHSFRRGGAQWFITVERWSILKLCLYGGWSTEFDGLTIVRYIIGALDENYQSPETYMDKEYNGGTVKCPECQRNCLCS